MSTDRERDERELAEAKRELEWAVTDREEKEARRYLDALESGFLTHVRQLLRDLRDEVEMGNRQWESVAVPGHSTVYFYVAGLNWPEDLWRAQNTIERHHQWAIIHDYSQNRWEMWENGSCLGPFEKEEVIRTMAKLVVRKG